MCCRRNWYWWWCRNLHSLSWRDHIWSQLISRRDGHRYTSCLLLVANVTVYMDNCIVEPPAASPCVGHAFPTSHQHSDWPMLPLIADHHQGDHMPRLLTQCCIDGLDGQNYRFQPGIYQALMLDGCQFWKRYCRYWVNPQGSNASQSVNLVNQVSDRCLSAYPLLLTHYHAIVV